MKEVEDLNKEYPVIYYDISQANPKWLETIAKQLDEYFSREYRLPLIFLPKNAMVLKTLNKEEVLKDLNEIIKEVESWQ